MYRSNVISSPAYKLQGMVGTNKEKSDKQVQICVTVDIASEEVARSRAKQG